MYLSGLEILGFKSFPYKTSLEFAPGLTGVVGPNGCGKTNVLDAIRWVLGEQRVSILRGGKMEDVIFSGTRDLKPLGMAEVALHIVNNHGILPTEYNNVTVARRLYRSGESEYLLNNVVCRLKDITDLFADTGMGANAYSAIELDMVESILSDKADQRRVLFEEAAGITRYKNRKRAALRKLEATEQDLLRLHDILAEVSSQVSGLSRQMRKAERYKALNEQVRHLGQVMLKERYRRLRTQLNEVRDQCRLGEIKLAQVNAEINRWELAREEFAAQSLDVSQSLREWRARMEEASVAAHRLETETSIIKERLAAADVADQADRQEIANIKRKIDQLAQEEQKLKANLADLRREQQSTTEELRQNEADYSEQLARLETARRTAETAQRDLYEIESRRLASDQTRHQLTRQLEELEEERSRIEGRLAELERELAANSSEYADLQQRRGRSEGEVARMETHLSTLLTQRKELELSIAQLRNEINALQLDRRSDEAQAEIVSRMLAHYEGYGSGVAAVFAHRDELEGIVDTVANLVQTEPRYLTAIETALGDATEYVLVRDREAAQKAIDFLRENGHGRVTFVLQSELAHYNRDGKLARPGGLEGRIIPAVDIVSSAPDYAELVDFLLGDVLVAADQGAAEQMIRYGQGTIRVVTHDGLYFPARQLQSGGGNESAKLIGREEELERLRQRLVSSGARLKRLEEQSESTAERIKQLQSEIEETEGKLFGRQEASREGLKSELSRLEMQLTAVTLREKQLSESRQELESSLHRTRERQRTVKDEMTELESSASQLSFDTELREQSFRDEHQTLGTLEHNVEAAARRVEDLRVRSIRLETEVSSLEGNLRRINDLREDLNRQRNAREEAIETRQIERARLNERLDLVITDLKLKTDAVVTLRTDEEQLTARQAELNDKQGEFDQLLKAQRRERDDVSGVNRNLLVQETELKARLEDLSAQLQEHYGIDARTMALPEPIADETFAQMEAELSDARSRQQQLGMVNMLALEEYEKEAEREAFLRNQIEDLTRAKDDLKATINRINTAARRMFTETFDKVCTNFQQVFAELFQGGEADLRLEDESDPLESPILISARPRGKRLLNISQLSGGEKALTAISLLFAIYLVKPSPFCILDEVDAPLDDANVVRFLRMVKSFAGRTQFIIITHNKRTMEQCDRLYGVTMQHPGVSQIVSVDFENKAHGNAGEILQYGENEQPAVTESDSQIQVDETNGHEVGQIEIETPNPETADAVVAKPQDAEFRTDG